MKGDAKASRQARPGVDGRAWALALGLALLGATLAPRGVAAQDPMPEPVPDTLTGVPDTIRGVPDTLTAVPDTILGVPDTLTAVPDTLTGVDPAPAAPGAIILRTPIPERPAAPGVRPNLPPGVVAPAEPAPAAVPAEAVPAEAAPGERRPPGRGPALLGATAAQGPGPLVQDTARRHRVRLGDTLWDLAAAYLGDPWLWPRIFDVNRDVVENPHWIYPAEWLLIPGLADELAGRARPPEQAVDIGAEAALPVERPALRQAEAEAEAEGEIDDVEGLPAPVTAALFRSAPWLANPGTLQPKGEFVRILDPGTATGADPSARPVRPHDLIYLRYEDGARPEVGEELLLVRIEEEERRYEGYGRVITPTAAVRVVSLTRDVMTGEVVHQFGKVNPGDLLLPTVPAPDLAGMRADPVGDGPRGMLMGFTMDHPLHSVTDIGFVDLGRAQGLDVGDELVVYLPGREVGATEDALPAEPIATLRVIRTTERTSTVMVTAVSQPVLQAGLPVRVFRKIR